MQEIESFTELKRRNCLVDLQVEMGVKGFSKICNCQGNSDKCSFTLDYILASECLWEQKWVQKFKILTHITSSDHLPQSIEVNAVLFEDSVQTMPREKVLEEHSQCCGEHTKDALELLEELDVAVDPFDVEDRCAGPSESETIAANMEIFVKKNQKLFHKWDPEGLGVFPCDNLNEFLTWGEIEEEWLDPTAREGIFTAEYIMENSEIQRVVLDTRVEGVGVQALVDSGSTKSMLDWKTLVDRVGRTRRKKCCLKEDTVLTLNWQIKVQCEVGGR